MVVDLLEDERADGIFRALADATRRDILVQVIDREQSVSALARRYPMSITAVQKHVAVLEAATLVARRRQGREQLVSARMDGVRRAAALLDRIEQLWRHRLERAAEILSEEGHRR